MLISLLSFSAVVPVCYWTSVRGALTDSAALSGGAKKHSQQWSGPLEMLQLNAWCSPLSSRIPCLPPSQIAPVPIRMPRGELRRCIWGTVQLRGPMTEGRWHDAAAAAVTAASSKVWVSTGKVSGIGMRAGIYLWWRRTCKWRSPCSYPWSHKGFLLFSFPPIHNLLPSLSSPNHLLAAKKLKSALSELHCATNLHLFGLYTGSVSFVRLLP